MREIKNILVTGGAGFIGSAFIRYVLSFLSFNGKIINLDLLTYAADLKNLEHIEDDPRYIFIKGNICDQKLVLNICEKYNIDTIVHFAAETHVDNSIESPSSFIETNIFGTFSLLEAVKKNKNIHFHHISTDEVYGSLKDKKGFFTENSCYRPNSPYSASKASSDHLVRSYQKTYNISATMSHCTNNYGPGQHEEKLIPLMIKNCIEKSPLPVYGKGENIRDWLYVDDHAEAVWQILNKGRKNEVYDIGGGEEFSNIDLIYLLIDVLSEELEEKKESFFKLISFVKDRPGHDFRYAIDTKKINNELNWYPKCSFKEGLKKTVCWYNLKMIKKNVLFI
jgi:dTDP-glucose 4,6-dehydratase